MYYANDEKETRVDIDSAVLGDHYFCPVCNSQMIIKRGKIVAPHFAHKSNTHCDPWYTGKMSSWHRRMQNKFPTDMREVALWNDDKTEFHIADVLVGDKGDGTVFEFQHSDISVKEFIDRTKFYMSIGCSVVWIFDYQDRGRPKCMYYKDTEYSEQIKRVTWPGRDRVKLFDSEILRTFIEECNSDAESQLSVLFHVSTGPGKRCFCQYQNGYESYKWEYIDPFNRESYFIKPYLEETDSISDFLAAFFTEDEIDKHIKKMVIKHNNKALK